MPLWGEEGRESTRPPHCPHIGVLTPISPSPFPGGRRTLERFYPTKSRSPCLPRAGGSAGRGTHTHTTDFSAHSTKTSSEGLGRSRHRPVALLLLLLLLLFSSRESTEHGAARSSCGLPSDPEEAKLSPFPLHHPRASPWHLPRALRASRCLTLHVPLRFPCAPFPGHPFFPFSPGTPRP